MRRRHWLGALGAAAGACLFAGCLGGPAHRAVSRDFTAAVPEGAAAPPGQSTYHAHLLASDVRPARTPEEALARVRLDVKAPEPPPPPPEVKPAAAVSPAPAAPPPDAPLVAALRCVLENHPTEALP